MKKISPVMCFIVSLVCAVVSTIATIKGQSIPGVVSTKLALLLTDKIATIIGIACMIVGFLNLSGNLNKK